MGSIGARGARLYEALLQETETGRTSQDRDKSEDARNKDATDRFSGEDLLVFWVNNSFISFLE